MRRSKKSSPRRLCGFHSRSSRSERRANFVAAEDGNIVVIFAMAAPVLLGVAGLAIDVGRWELAHRGLQRAADSAVMSAAVAYQASGDASLPTQAKAIAANYNFVDGVAETSVTVHRPPSSGAYMSNAGAVEVIVTQPQPRIFSALFGSSMIAERARAVAIGGSNACVLALSQTATPAINAQGNVNVAANGCAIYSDSKASNSINVGGTAQVSALQVGAVGGIADQSKITTTKGITHGGVLGDPYAGVTTPSGSGCDQTNFSSKKTETISPGTYCKGFTLNAGANVTMSPGVYFMDRGTFTINGGATLTGTGVTIVFTSSTNSNYADAKIAGGAVVNLTAPSSGATAGIVMFGDRKMPLDTTFNLAGGSTQSLNGAVYFPKGAVTYAGGASTFNGCTQVIADIISFVGSSGLATNCTAMGVKKIGSAAQLLE
jgi:hypothetical protein